MNLSIPFPLLARPHTRKPRLVRLAAISLAAVALCGVARQLHAAEFHVAPGGSPAANGTASAPFATLAQARDAARKLPANELRRIVVHGGEYFDVGLLLEPADSGLSIDAAPGEHPILYGGQRVTGWERAGDHLWSAPLPPLKVTAAEVQAGLALPRWEPRLLLVNGETRPRARFPAEGTLEHLSRFDVPWMSTTGGGWKRPPTNEELTTLKYKAGDLADWPDLTNAEVTVYHMWDESCVGIASHDVANHILKLAPECGHPPGAFGVRKYVLWNLRAGLTRPGQWLHDRARNRIIYWPLPGEDLAQAQVIAPSRPSIIRVQGHRGTPVRVALSGLTLSATTVPLVAGGFAAARFDGAISLNDAADCVLSNLTLRGVAGQAIKAGRGAKNIRVADCEVSDCGAGGIYVGGESASIVGNRVHGIGRSYPSGIGIFEGGERCVVAHNEVHDCSYSAINYGGVSNVVSDNVIYDCMKALHDGAAIYMFAATNCVLRGNLARDFTDTGGYGASAYYLDERSTGCVVEKNVALRVGWPSHNHMATNNIIRNNLFLVEGDAKLTFPRSADYTLEKNILVATGKIRIENVGAVTHWFRNLFFSRIGKIEQVRMEAYSAKETVLGPPGDTFMADPMLVDPAKGDFHFRPGSPAIGLGIEPVDISQAGPIR